LLGSFSSIKANYLPNVREPDSENRFLFEREMACIEDIIVDLSDIPLVGQRPGFREKGVILAPNNQYRRLPIPQMGLPGGVAFEVIPVIVEQIKLVYPRKPCTPTFAPRKS
jgi:hypothetical protein